MGSNSEKKENQSAQTSERDRPRSPMAEIDGSAVGDIHRDFETETQISERRGGPLHGESPVVGKKGDHGPVTAFSSNRPVLL